MPAEEDELELVVAFGNLKLAEDDDSDSRDLEAAFLLKKSSIEAADESRFL